MDRVSFTGIDGSKLDPYLAPVLSERPLRLSTLERSLLLVSELAGVTAQANIRAVQQQVVLDLAKNVFQVHGVNVHGKVVLRNQLRRDQVAFILRQSPRVPGRHGGLSRWATPRV